LRWQIRTCFNIHRKKFIPRELLDAYIQSALVERSDKTRYSFSIYCKEHEAYAGSTAYMNVSAADDRLEIGATWLGREFQGTGLNRQCKYLLLHHAFEIIGAHRLNSEPMKGICNRERPLKRSGESLRAV
jgi:RimJ/RimL family protein N-acetyltransferase